MSPATSNPTYLCVGRVATLSCDNCTVVELAGTSAIKHKSTVPLSLVPPVGTVGAPHLYNSSASVVILKNPGHNTLTTTSAPAASGGTGNTCGLTTVVRASMVPLEASCGSCDHRTSTHVAASTATTTTILSFKVTVPREIYLTKKPPKKGNGKIKKEVWQPRYRLKSKTQVQFLVAPKLPTTPMQKQKKVSLTAPQD